MPLEFSKLLRDTFQLRQNSDYDDFFSVDKDDIEKYIVPVKNYIAHAKHLIAQR